MVWGCLLRNVFLGMEKSRLISLVRTFSRKEWRDFRKWLLSPAHNQREDVLILYDFLFENDRFAEDGQISREQAFQALFPGETFDDARLRQVMYFFLSAAEEFLVYQEQTKDEINNRLTIARVYRQRQLGKFFERTARETVDALKKQPYRNQEFLENDYLLQYEQYYYLSGQTRTGPMNLQEVSNALDRHYLASKMRLACLMVAHQTVFKLDYQIGMLDHLLRFVESEGYLSEPAVAIYYYSYKSLVERNREEHFQKLKEELFQHGDLFPESEIRDIHLLAINYCIGRMNAGVESYIRETFDLYKHGLEKNLLLQNGVLSRWTFRNIVANGAMLGEFEWTQRFMDAYKKYIEDQYRDSMVHYCQARLHYEMKNYPQAMVLLNQVEYDDILLNLHAKVMLLKMYFEQDEFTALDSLLESMRMYMRRKKVIGYHKSNYTNLIQLTRKMTHINPFDEGQRAKLKTEIEEANPLTEKKWMLGQLERIGL